MVQLFFTAFFMSILFAAQPGVIAFEALRRGMERGFFAALNIEFGSLIGDAVWAALALAGAAILFQNPIVALLLSIVGCFLLLKFAWEAWQSSHEERDTTTQPVGRSNDFLAGAMLSLSNPQNITFWLGMSGIVVSLGFTNPQPIHLAVFFSGFMIAQVVWCFFFAGLVSYSATFMNEKTFNYINFVSAIVLGYFGIDLLLDTIQAVLSY